MDRTPSTNVEVKNASRLEQDEGYVATSLVQDAGYGRQGRAWESPLGGLYFSLLLRPYVPAAQKSTFSLVASLAVEEAVDAIIGADGDRGAHIKWPNDVLIAGKKLVGISNEADDDIMCTGIGINVFEPAHELAVAGKNTPAYLGMFLPDVESRVAHDGLSGDQIDVLEQLLAHTLLSLDMHYHQWLTEGFASFAEVYNRHMAHKGDFVTVVTRFGATIASGNIVGVNTDGCLLLEDQQGVQTPVATGEVHLI